MIVSEIKSYGFIQFNWCREYIYLKKTHEPHFNIFISIFQIQTRWNECWVLILSWLRSFVICWLLWMLDHSDDQRIYWVFPLVCFNQKFLTFLLRLSAYWLFLFETTTSFNAQYSRSGEHPVYRSVAFSIINEHFTNNNLRSAHSTFYQFQDEAKK